MAETVSAVANPARQAAKEQYKDAKKNNFNGAVLTKHVTLGSPIAKQQFNRYFHFLGRSCFFIHVFAQVLLKDEAALGDADTIIQNSIKKAAAETDKMISIANQLALKANITELSKWSQPVTLDADVITPQSNAYLRLFEQADTLDCLINTLWFEGEIDDKQKREMQGEMRKLLRAVSITAGNTQRGLLRRINEQKKTSMANEVAGSDVIQASATIESDLKAATSAEVGLHEDELNVEAQPAATVGG